MFICPFFRVCMFICWRPCQFLSNAVSNHLATYWQVYTGILHGGHNALVASHNMSRMTESCWHSIPPQRWEQVYSECPSKQGWGGLMPSFNVQSLDLMLIKSMYNTRQGVLLIQPCSRTRFVRQAHTRAREVGRAGTGRCLSH